MRIALPPLLALTPRALPAETSAPPAALHVSSLGILLVPEGLEQSVPIREMAGLIALSAGGW